MQNNGRLHCTYSRPIYLKARYMYSARLCPVCRPMNTTTGHSQKPPNVPERLAWPDPICSRRLRNSYDRVKKAPAKPKASGSGGGYGAGGENAQNRRKGRARRSRRSGQTREPERHRVCRQPFRRRWREPVSCESEMGQHSRTSSSSRFVCCKTNVWP